MTETPDTPASGRAPDPDLRELVDTAHRVTDEIAALQNTLKRSLAIERRARRRGIRRTSLFVAADVVLSIVGLVLWVQQRDTNYKLAESLRQNYVTASQQAQTRVRVLCPLYALLVATENPADRNTLPAAQQAVYDHTVQVIRDGYTALGCQPALAAVAPSPQR